jgi:hypothetical protein
MWWHTVTHGRGSEGETGEMEWVANTLHTTSEHGVSSITTVDEHTPAVSSRLHWRPRRFKWTRPFRRKTKSGFCACAITFQTQSTKWWRRFRINRATKCRAQNAMNLTVRPGQEKGPRTPHCYFWAWYWTMYTDYTFTRVYPHADVLTLIHLT